MVMIFWSKGNSFFLNLSAIFHRKEKLLSFSALHIFHGSGRIKILRTIHLELDNHNVISEGTFCFFFFFREVLVNAFLEKRKFIFREFMHQFSLVKLVPTFLFLQQIVTEKES